MRTARHRGREAGQRRTRRERRRLRGRGKRGQRGRGRGGEVETQEGRRLEGGRHGETNAEKTKVKKQQVDREEAKWGSGEKVDQEKQKGQGGKEKG